MYFGVEEYRHKFIIYTNEDLKWDKKGKKMSYYQNKKIT